MTATDGVTTPPVRYADFMPFATPDSLDDLQGPLNGVVIAPHRICTAPDSRYDLDRPALRWSLYSATVRDGTAADQAALLDKDELIRLWPDLNLPGPCRDKWERKFPLLADRSRGAVVA